MSDQAAPVPAAPRSPTHAERTRTLVDGSPTATLATWAREPAGFPFASLVSLAADEGGAPLLLLSTLAEHTQNLLLRTEASLLVSEPLPADQPDVDPLAMGRATLIGRCRRIEADEVPQARARFLEVHPEAEGYIDFRDFGLWRLQPEAVRYVGGFGRMSWVDAAAYVAAEPDPLRTAADSILAHMNDDHGEALLDYARLVARVDGATAARMKRVDRYGFDLRVETAEGSKPVRIAFGAEATTPEAVRRELVAMVKEARAARPA